MGFPTLRKMETDGGEESPFSVFYGSCHTNCGLTLEHQWGHQIFCEMVVFWFSQLENMLLRCMAPCVTGIFSF